MSHRQGNAFGDSNGATTAPRTKHASVIWLVAFMWVAYFLNYCDRQAVFAMFKVLKTDLDMTDAQLGLIGAIFLWVYGIGCPIAGMLADRMSKRILVVASLAIWSLVTIATGMATSVLQLLTLRGAMGVSEALYMPAAISLTANAAPSSQRSRAVAFLTTAQIVGTVAGSWFGGWMSDMGAWRGAFFILGALGLVYVVPYAIFLRRVDETTPDEKGSESSGNSAWILATTPTYIVLCIAFPIFVFGLWMLYSWLPSYLEGKFQLGAADAALLATAPMQSATLVGLFVGGMLADRLYLRAKGARLWLLLASLILCAPCMHGIGQSATPVQASIALIGFGLFSGFMIGNIFPAAFEVLPTNARATAVGVLNFFGAALSGFAPLVVGTWKQTVGIDRMLSITAIAYLVAAMLVGIAVIVFFPKDFKRRHAELAKR